MNTPTKTSTRRRSRKTRWEFNLSLFVTSMIAALVIALIAGGLYWRQSSQLVSSLSAQVDQAGEAQDWEKQIKWLRRQQMLQQGDVDAAIQLGLAADKAAGSATSQDIGKVDRARRFLRDALTAIHNVPDDAEESQQVAQGTEEDLRRRLIKRLLQYGGLYANQIEAQVLASNANAHDPEMLRALAIAKYSIASRQSEAAANPVSSADDEAAQIDESNPVSAFWQAAAKQALGPLMESAWQANPDDLTLSAQLIDLCVNRPETFIAEIGSADSAATAADTDARLQTLAAEVADTIAEQKDEGRALWIVTQYKQSVDPGQTPAFLKEVAPGALARLQAHAANLPETDGKEKGSAAKDIAKNQASDEQDYQPRWDYELVLFAATGSAEDAADATATDLLDALIALPQIEVPAAVVQSTYLARGRQWILDEKMEPVLGLWNQGVERLADDGLDLQLARASLLLQLQKPEQAVEATDKLNSLIRRLSVRLAGPEGSQLSANARRDQQGVLDRAGWMVESMRGQADFQQGKYPEAIRRLSTVLESQVKVDTAQRVGATVLLARGYEEIQAWDQAASTYERAINLSPEQDALRAQAAQAWMRAGDIDRAAGQWASIRGSDPGVALAQLQTELNGQLTLPEPQRNYARLEQGINQLRSRLTKLAESDSPPENLSELQARNELLALALPQPQSSEAKPAIERLEELSKQYVEVIELQAAAAVGLAAAGNADGAKSALSRLEAAAGADSLPYVSTQARILAQRKEWEEAVTRLQKFAEGQPEEAADVLKLAADIAMANDASQQADELLQSIPAEQQTPEQTYQRFQIALSTFSKVSSSAEDFIAAKKSLVDLEDRIREQEGEGGSWWRLARAKRLLAEWDHTGRTDPGREQKLQDALFLQAELRNNRPRWGMGLTLAGEIAARRGQTGRAITSLREGIAAGDRRISTLLLLVAELTQANRVAEAEAEFSRFQQLSSRSTMIGTLGVAIAAQKGDYEQSLKLARSGSKQNPRDTSAWLLLGQTAAYAARAAEEGPAKTALVDEAMESYAAAIQYSGDTSLPAYQARMRLLATLGKNEEVKQELLAAAKSKIAEPQRSLYVGVAYLELRDFQAALPAIQRVLRIAPDNADGYLAMAEYHRLMQQDTESIAMLEKAFEVAPRRADVRNRLALAVALREGAEVPWERLEKILTEETGSGTQNQLLHALILINRGDADRQDQAAKILRELIRVGGSQADDATRMLAALERRRWAIADEANQTDDARRALGEARRLYGLLTRRPEPAPMDLYRFADLLLRAEQTADVNALADQLDQMTQGSPIALDVRLRLARQNGEEDKVKQLTEQWAKQAVQGGTFREAGAWETAGRTLSKLGFHEEALEWLGQAYKNDPTTFRVYVVGLARGRQFQRAIQVCRDHFQREQHPDAVALMADVVIIADKVNEVPEEVETLFASTLKRFGSDPRLVESLGTLRLSQQRYPEAISLYTRAEQLAPQNVRVLNNLAMALSEIPDRTADAIPRIQKAIDLYGRSPELLDTQGLVFLRNNRLPEAIEALSEATSASDDPRYRFHLLMALIRSGDEQTARSQWAQLDLRELKKTVLTPSEKRDLEAMQEKFAAHRPT